MSVTVTQELTQQTVTVTGNPVENNVTVTVSNARGPAGTGGGGSVAWDDLTGTASDVPFLPVAAPSHSEGLVFYDSTDKSLTYYNDEADVSMNIGRELWVRVRNDSGSQISNGKVVYINDAVGQLPTIRLARADSAVTSRVIGIATHDIGNNEFGYVTTTGEVKGLATNAYDDGDLLFLSAVTAGEMTTTAPLAPNRVIQVATVLHAHPTQGKLYCHPETDSIPSTGIVDSTATGRALITAANAAAARTTLELAAAATASTPDTLALRDGTGGTSFAGTVVMNVADIADLQFEDYQAAVGATFTYDDAAAAAHRTALRSGATGDELFRALTPAAARTTLGTLSATATGTTAAASTTTDVVSITIPGAGFWSIEVLATFENSGSSSTLFSVVFDAAAEIPATAFRIGTVQVSTSIGALSVLLPSRVATLGTTVSSAGLFNSSARGLIRTTGASVVTLRIANTVASGTTTAIQSALIATQL